MIRKLCKRCGEVKESTEFYAHANRPDGLQVYCKPCKKLFDKESYKTHREVTITRNRANRQRNRQLVYDYLSTHPCVDCGEADVVVLEFDHQKNKTLDVSRLFHATVSPKRIFNEIAKCQVRCVNCHRKKTFKTLGYRRLGLQPV